MRRLIAALALLLVPAIACAGGVLNPATARLDAKATSCAVTTDGVAHTAYSEATLDCGAGEQFYWSFMWPANPGTVTYRFHGLTTGSNTNTACFSFQCVCRRDGSVLKNPTFGTKVYGSWVNSTTAGNEEELVFSSFTCAGTPQANDRCAGHVVRETGGSCSSDTYGLDVQFTNRLLSY